MSWVDTARMKKILGISDKTLLSLKNHTTMFREGQDWRRKGVSARSPLQWHVESTEQAFTNWKRPAPNDSPAGQMNVSTPIATSVRSQRR